jgi:hypothetical protein
MVSELAARHVANVQLQRFALSSDVRRGRQGITAPCTVALDKFNILPRFVLQRVAGWQLQFDRHDIVRLFLQGNHARRHAFDGEGVRRCDLARLQHYVALRLGAAGQNIAFSFFLFAQSFLLMLPVNHFAFQHLALARATRAVFATIGHGDALANACGQNGFIRSSGKTAVAG